MSEPVNELSTCELVCSFFSAILKKKLERVEKVSVKEKSGNNSVEVREMVSRRYELMSNGTKSNITLKARKADHTRTLEIR